MVPSTLVATPAATASDAHDYETQDDWDESPSHEYYSGDKVGSSEEDDDEEEDPHYEPVSLSCQILHDVL